MKKRSNIHGFGGNSSEMKISTKAVSKDALGVCEDSSPSPLSRLQVSSKSSPACSIFLKEISSFNYYLFAFMGNMAAT